MVKKILSVLFAVILVLLSPIPVFGKNYVNPVYYLNPSPTPTPVAEVNSFELFWPLVAGRTAENRYYVFKLFKEKLRGFLIFDKVKKTDYHIFLAEKRILEAELLLNKEMGNLANNTINDATKHLDIAGLNLDLAKSSGVQVDQDSKDGINNRLDNLNKFIPYLIIKNPSHKDKLQQVLDKIKLIASKI